MMKDQFANYVIQKMLDVVDHEQREVLIEKIKPHLSSLRKFTYGKHLITSKHFFFMEPNDSLCAKILVKKKQKSKRFWLKRSTSKPLGKLLRLLSLSIQKYPNF
jgi:hypothetical protein